MSKKMIASRKISVSGVVCRALSLCAAAILLASCATPKQLNYLQDMTNLSQIELENKFEARIIPYDELTIRVSAVDEELAKPFNYINSQSNTSTGQSRTTYLVDVNGNIQFPILGQIRAQGKTRLQLQEEITKMLQEGHYIDDPYVMVRFDNFKIFYLTPDNGKVINVSNERCTFLEALAMAGGLETLAKRSKIAVLREVDGKMTMRYLDPRSSQVFSDPYFMLKQNDIIITENHATSYALKEISFITPLLAFVSTIASFATMIIVLCK